MRTRWPRGFSLACRPRCKNTGSRLDVTVDDQDHTLEWLKNGDVIGCVTTLATALRGCVAEPLGTMRYRCVAAPRVRDALQAKNSSNSGPRCAPTTGAPAIGLHQLVTQPAIGFNRKDGLQDAFLRQCFGMTDLAYPRHYIPAVDAYHDALLGGLGWGMQADIQSPSDLQSGALVDLFPGQWVDVPLFWHHWQREAPQAARLTLAIKAAAGKLALALVHGCGIGRVQMWLRAIGCVPNALILEYQKSVDSAHTLYRLRLWPARYP